MKRDNNMEQMRGSWACGQCSLCPPPHRASCLSCLSWGSLWGAGVNLSLLKEQLRSYPA